MLPNIALEYHVPFSDTVDTVSITQVTPLVYHFINTVTGLREMIKLANVSIALILLNNHMCIFARIPCFVRQFTLQGPHSSTPTPPPPI